MRYILALHNEYTYITDMEELNEIQKVAKMLSPSEKVLLVARQSRYLPGGSMVTPNIVIATDRRIILRNPYMLGIKSELIDIPYDVITSVKLKKGVFTSTILFKAPALINQSRLGLLNEDIDGEDDQDGVIEAISKDKAEHLLEIIRRGIRNIDEMHHFSMQRDSMSIADELAKLSKLKEQGIITDSDIRNKINDILNIDIDVNIQQRADMELTNLRNSLLGSLDYYITSRLQKEFDRLKVVTSESIYRFLSIVIEFLEVKEKLILR